MLRGIPIIDVHPFQSLFVGLRILPRGTPIFIFRPGADGVSLCRFTGHVIKQNLRHAAPNKGVRFIVAFPLPC